MGRKTRTARKGILVYADTSVYGGAFDNEFDDASRRFFDSVRDGQFRIAVSAVIQDEIAKAPARVRALFDEMAQRAEFAYMTDIAETLQHAYLAAKIVPAHAEPDALHVALATAAGCEMISEVASYRPATDISWNFKHIVNYRRIPLYNEINRRHGRPEIAIFSPLEVISDEDEEF